MFDAATRLVGQIKLGQIKLGQIWAEWKRI